MSTIILTCENCNKTFATKQMLSYHIKHLVCKKSDFVSNSLNLSDTVEKLVKHIENLTIRVNSLENELKEIKQDKKKSQKVKGLKNHRNGKIFSLNEDRFCVASDGNVLYIWSYINNKNEYEFLTDKHKEDLNNLFKSYGEYMDIRDDKKTFYLCIFKAGINLEGDKDITLDREGVKFPILKNNDYANFDSEELWSLKKEYRNIKTLELKDANSDRVKKYESKLELLKDIFYNKFALKYLNTKDNDKILLSYLENNQL
jgi:hypothetical protein